MARTITAPNKISVINRYQEAILKLYRMETREERLLYLEESKMSNSNLIALLDNFEIIPLNSSRQRIIRELLDNIEKNDISQIVERW